MLTAQTRGTENVITAQTRGTENVNSSNKGDREY